MPTSSLRPSAVAAVLLAAVAVAACGNQGSQPPTTAERGLSGVCPDTVVIQTDWEPEAEKGGVYALLGTDYTVDTNRKAVSGPLMASGEPTGVNVEIRVGGRSVGYRSPESLLYQDRDILLGYGRTTEYLATQRSTPVTAVLAAMEKSPYAIYWDPQTYPTVTKIRDLRNTGATVSVGSEGVVWIDYLVGSGQLDETQLDRRAQDKPAMFVAAGGRLAEAGFITAEPFTYEHEVADWRKPVVGELLADAGYPEYFQALIVRTSDVQTRSACLEKLVPIMQQAQVDYIEDPASTNALIVELVGEYATGWPYSAEAAEYAHKTAVANGIFADGPDGVMGSFDIDRVQTLIDIVDEYSDADVAGIGPDDLVTNQFLETSINTEG